MDIPINPTTTRGRQGWLVASFGLPAFCIADWLRRSTRMEYVSIPASCESAFSRSLSITSVCLASSLHALRSAKSSTKQGCQIRPRQTIVRTASSEPTGSCSASRTARTRVTGRYVLLLSVTGCYSVLRDWACSRARVRLLGPLAGTRVLWSVK